MKERIVRLKELFENAGGLSKEVSKEIVDEMTEIFEYILYRINSPVPEEKKEALEIASELKHLLESQQEKAQSVMNMTPEQLSAFVNNNNNFSKEEWQALQNAKASVENFKSSLVKEGILKGQEEKTPKKYLSKKTWIPS